MYFLIKHFLLSEALLSGVVSNCPRVRLLRAAAYVAHPRTAGTLRPASCFCYETAVSSSQRSPAGISNGLFNPLLSPTNGFFIQSLL